MNYMIIINGHPRAGKDTVAGFLVQIAEGLGYAVDQHSSINPVINGLHKGFGIKPPEEKTEKWRALLANVGRLLEDYTNFRSNEMIKLAALGPMLRYSISGGKRHRPRLVTVMAREADVIQRIKERVSSIRNGFSVKEGRPAWTVLVLRVSSDRAKPVLSNESDAHVADVEHDLVLYNNGSKGQLYDRVEEMFDTLIRGET